MKDQITNPQTALLEQLEIPSLEIPSLNRRRFLTMSAAAGAAATLGAAPLIAQPGQPAAAEPDYSKVPQLPWPTAPYRAWYGAGFYHRDFDAYRHINVDASGETSHLTAGPLGIATLNWTYGTNNPYSKGPESWSGAFTPKSLTRGKDTPNPVMVPGIILDEWVPVPEKKPENEKWMVEGLRQGKKANPKCFVAAWVTHPTQAMFDVGKDNTVDLFIIEGYTHLGRDLPPDWALTWDEATGRMDAFKKAGLLSKTIFGFGHISTAAVSVEDGSPLTTTWLHTKMREIKDRYPESPGIGFFPGDFSAPGTEDMVRFVNNLAGELWPDRKRATRR